LERSDGLSNLIFTSIGPIAYRVSVSQLAEQKFISIPTINIIDTEFSSQYISYKLLIDSLISNNNRNKLIIKYLRKHTDQFNLILSNRISHLENLAKLYSRYSSDYSVVVGAVKRDEGDRIVQKMRDKKLHTIFATQLADEGLDIPNLDNLYLAYPTKALGAIEQRIGRIQRYGEDKRPIVYDFADIWVNKFSSFSNKRISLYNNLGLKIKSDRRMVKFGH